jgi:hypothetical protein
MKVMWADVGDAMLLCTFVCVCVCVVSQFQWQRCSVLELGDGKDEETIAMVVADREWKKREVRSAIVVVAVAWVATSVMNAE